MTTNRVIDNNGWFEVKRNPLSRIGIFPYSGRSLGCTGADADRVFRVYRPEEELSSPECLDSFKLIPWVDDHTMLGPGDDTTPAEAKGVQGVIGEEVFYDSGVVYGNIKAFANSLSRLIDAGKRELSAGYRCVYDWTAGVWNGQPYDCVQRQIRGNHLALVQEGRMGPSVAVLDSMTFTFDAQEAVMADPEKNPADGGTPDMTLTQLAELVKSFGPQIAAINEALAGLAKPAAAVADPAADAGAVAPVKDPNAPPPAAAAAGAMDAALAPIRATVETLSKTVAGMDAALKAMAVPTVATLGAELAAKGKLADRIAAVVGTFDHAEKTLAQVAAYGVEKLGLKVAAGHELTAVDAYLTAAEKAVVQTVRHGLDAAVQTGENFVTRHLSPVAAK